MTINLKRQESGHRVEWVTPFHNPPSNNYTFGKVRGGSSTMPRWGQVELVDGRLALRACEQPWLLRSKCWQHGNERRFAAGCGKCSYCLWKWCKVIQAKITEGMKQQQALHPLDEEYFVTFTLGGKYHGGKPTTAEWALQSWRRLKRSTWLRRRYRCNGFARVIEYTQRGRAHLHLVWRGSLPIIYRARKKGEKLSSWRHRQTPEARDFIDRAVKAGFAPIMSIERVRGGSAVAGAYLAKYLSKADRKTMSRRGEMRTRVFDTSKGWFQNPVEKKFLWHRPGGGKEWHSHYGPQPLRTADCLCEPERLRAAGPWASKQFLSQVATRRDAILIERLNQHRERFLKLVEQRQEVTSRVRLYTKARHELLEWDAKIRPHATEGVNSRTASRFIVIERLLKEARLERQEINERLAWLLNQTVGRINDLCR